METSGDKRLEQAAATLNDLIALMRDQGLNETAQFLAMAKLNLLMDINGITAKEFRALCVALESEPNPAPRRGGRRSGSARRKGVQPDGGMPRVPDAWIRLDRVAASRSGRGRAKQ